LLHGDSLMLPAFRLRKYGRKIRRQGGSFHGFADTCIRIRDPLWDVGHVQPHKANENRPPMALSELTSTAVSASTSLNAPGRQWAPGETFGWWLSNWWRIWWIEKLKWRCRWMRESHRAIFSLGNCSTSWSTHTPIIKSVGQIYFELWRTRRLSGHVRTLTSVILKSR
jgi:hypothetical protein